MTQWTRWLHLIAGLAAAFVAVSSVTLAIRQGSWAPIVTVGWLPAVIVAVTDRPGELTGADEDQVRKVRTHSLGGRCQGWLRVYVNQAVSPLLVRRSQPPLIPPRTDITNPRQSGGGSLHLPRSRRHGPGGHRQTPRAPGPPARSCARASRSS